MTQIIGILARAAVNGFLTLLSVRSTTEALLIGLTSWPWAARAVRAQTFSLKTREFVDIARLSGRPTRRIIVSEIAPNMSSYLLMMFILLFGGGLGAVELGAEPGEHLRLHRLLQAGGLDHAALGAEHADQVELIQQR